LRAMIHRWDAAELGKVTGVWYHGPENTGE
jgi:hypothetical protein